jgi:DNA-binding XRE family transcriptional regulator
MTKPLRPLIALFERIETRPVCGPGIRRARQSRHISRADLAATVNVRADTIAHIETNRWLPSAKLLQRISTALNVPIPTLAQMTAQTPCTLPIESTPYSMEDTFCAYCPDQTPPQCPSGCIPAVPLCPRFCPEALQLDCCCLRPPSPERTKAHAAWTARRNARQE